jgi:Ca2+-binding RTX toxin-like protein
VVGTFGRDRRWAVLMVALAGIASAALPATSFAGTVTSSFGDVRYTAGAGEQNNVTVDLSGTTYTISDTGPGVTVTATAPCAQVTTTRATCPQEPLPSTDHVTVVVDDLNDTVTVNATARDGTRIDGGAGNDTIVGSTGADKITGGPGNDVIDPNDLTTPVNMDSNSIDPYCDPDFTDFSLLNCPDIVDGEGGFNTIRFDHQPKAVFVDAGTKGADPESVIDPTRLRNGDARANLLATKGRGWRFNKIVGTPFDDQIIGSSNADTIVGRGGADVLCGGPGTDTVDYSGSTGPVDVSLDTNLPADAKWESTNDQVRGYSRSDCRQTDSFGVVVQGDEKDCIANDGQVGSDGTAATGEHDCVGVDIENAIGSPSNDVLVGNDPGPYLDKAAFFEPRGMSVLNGGGGDDFLDGRGGADALIGGPGDHDTVSYATESLPVEVTLDGAANDGSTADLNTDSGLGDSVGTDVENVVGGSGDDTLGGSDADNVITGGTGNDVVQGGGGNDTLVGGDGNDFLQGEAGNDTLQADAGNDVMDGGTGPDTFSGGPDRDAVDYSNNTTSVVSIPDGAANDGNNGGAEGDNVGADVEDAFGGSANDTLVAGPGGGVVDGGAGNDTLVSGPGPDLIVGGEGIDNASYAGRNEPVSVDLAGGTGGEGDVLAQIEQATGGNGNDTISGNDAVNILDGGPGNDAIGGGGGDDQMFGGAGNDTLAGGPGNDTLSGDAGDDNLQGGDGADSLNGGDGNDQLDGGPAADALAGGPGDDRAVYSSRTKAVSVSTDGADNDGEANERDQVRLSVESVKAGAGNDTINVRDGVKGEVSCGAGRDSVVADRTDTIANDCEQKNTLSALATCTINSDPARMSKSGTIRVRVKCPLGGKAKLSLRTVGKAKRAKKLGSKSFKMKAGKRKTVRIKLSGKARRLVKKKKALRAHATVTVKAAVASRTAKRSENLTIVAPKGRKR